VKSTKIFIVIASLVFGVVFGSGLYLTHLRHNSLHDQQNQLVAEIGHSQASALQGQLSSSLATTYILAQEVIRTNGEFPEFEKYADSVLNSLSGVSNLQLAPQGIVSQIYPLAGNEKAIGHNILVDDKRRVDALLAIREKQLTLAGPFELIQGGVAVIGRNPVFIEMDGRDQFWGFTSALIFLDDLLSITELTKLEQKGYSYRLSRIDPYTGQIDAFGQSEAALTEPYQTQSINVPNGLWTLALSQPDQFSPIPGYLISFIIAMILSILLFMILLQPQKLRTTVEEKTQELKHQAFHDQLTGLGNRYLLYEQLNFTIGNAVRNGTSASLLCLDLDDFKRINDTMGHEMGDLLLQKMTKRFQQSLRKNDILARIGGDEFAILLLDTKSVSHVQKFTNKLIELIRQPVVLRNSEVTVSASIGISMIPENGKDANILLRNADVALYDAKRKGKNQSAFFESAMQETAMRHLQVEQDLRQSLNHHDLFLVYQPIVNLRTQKVIGFEALIRWQHPQQGLVLPDQFIPVAETTGLVIPLGYYVMQEACRLIKKREELGLEPVSIAINLSPQQFSDSKLLTRIQELLSETKIRPELLEIEITETSIMDNIDTAIATLTELRGMGLSVALDDFGTGHSSLSQLKILPVDTLKIDRSFINGIEGDDSDRSIVEAILVLSSKLKLNVVAEGIETAEQLTILEVNNCPFGQGYLFDRPLSEESMLERITDLSSAWPSHHSPAC
jgi:diguanylate cyclase (GGDEF)-like protein